MLKRVMLFCLVTVTFISQGLFAKKVVLVNPTDQPVAFDCDIDGGSNATGFTGNYTVSGHGSQAVEFSKNIKVTVTMEKGTRYATFTIDADQIEDEDTQVTFTVEKEKMYCDMQSGKPLEALIYTKTY